MQSTLSIPISVQVGHTDLLPAIVSLGRLFDLRTNEDPLAVSITAVKYLPAEDETLLTDIPFLSFETRIGAADIFRCNLPIFGTNQPTYPFAITPGISQSDYPLSVLLNSETRVRLFSPAVPNRQCVVLFDVVSDTGGGGNGGA
jgi:hypothetical protein